MGWRVTRGILGASNSAGRQLGSAAATRAAIHQAQRGSRAVGRGLVGPWDQVPAGAHSFLDYSGAARPQDLKAQEWVFALGRYVLPRSPRLGAAGFPSKSPLGISGQTANRHTVVYAPTQSGKTTSLIAPWIHAGLSHGYSVVALDLKGNGDLLSKVEQVAAAQGALPDIPVTDFDFTDARRSATWNWISDLNGDDAAIQAAAAAIVGEDRDVDPNREFRLRDLTWMWGLLEYASTSSHPWTVASLLRLLAQPERLRRYVANTAPPRAQARLASLVSLDDGVYYDRVQFLTAYLEVLNAADFDRVTERRGIDLTQVTSEPGLLVVTAPLANGRSSEAVSGLFLSQFLQRQLSRFNRAGQPVLLVLDEAPRLQKRLNLPQLMSTGASSGLSVLLAVQEVDDLDKDHRETILSNCATHVLMAGAGSPTTEYFGKRLGKRTAAQRTQSMNYSRREGQSFQTGVQNTELDVLGHTELHNPPGGAYGATVHCRDLSDKPVLVDLTRTDLAG